VGVVLTRATVWSQGTADMEDHEVRRKIIRQWMALPKDKRQTAEQAAAFSSFFSGARARKHKSSLSTAKAADDNSHPCSFFRRA
jgi:hypothetical protein